MQDFPHDGSSHDFGTLRGRGLALAATALLSLGVGAATAAFALVDGLAPHAPPVTCETMLELPPNATMYVGAGVPSSVQLREHVAGVYEMTYAAAEDADWSWPDMADDFDWRSLAPLFAGVALALLVASARGAARLLTAPRLAAIAAVSAIGAVTIAALLIDALGLPALGLRAIAFAIGVSMLAVRFARSWRKELSPATR
jgi:hypothetical protein